MGFNEEERERETVDLYLRVASPILLFRVWLGNRDAAVAGAQ